MNQGSLHKRLGDSYIWGLKYRPNDVESLILPERIKKQIQQIVNSKDIPNLLFSGPAGCGKTSTGVVLSEMLDFEYLYINGSEQNGIDVLRTKIRQFVTGTNWDNTKKIVILDEGDRLSPQAMDACKVFLEEFAKGCSFIFISNYKNKIIPPLQSRLQAIDFNFTNKELDKMKKEFFISVNNILKTEKVEYNKKVIANIVQRIFPDMRKCLNELQKYASQDSLTDINIVKDLSANDTEYFEILKNKNFTNMRKYIMGMNSDPQNFYAQLFDSCVKHIDPEYLPEFIILLNKYCVESTMVADPRINLMAFSTEVMMNGDFNE
jgi:DNA polymerase III delta prime subunit